MDSILNLSGEKPHLFFSDDLRSRQCRSTNAPMSVRSYIDMTSVTALTLSVRFISRAVMRAHLRFFQPVFNRELELGSSLDSILGGGGPARLSHQCEIQPANSTTPANLGPSTASCCVSAEDGCWRL